MKLLRQLLIVLVLASVGATAQDSTSGIGALTISGRVVDADSGAPLPNAFVSSAAKTVGTPVAMSDGEGQFTLVLPSDHRELAVFKSGYTRLTARTSPGPLLIRLERTVAIAGRVTDMLGEPVIGQRIVILRSSGPSPQAMIDAAQAVTDDRGEYRAGGLAADTFAVAIEGPPSARGMFYPGVDSTAAARLTLRPGEERAGIDFAIARQATYGLPLAPPTAGGGLLRGRVMTTDGQPVPNAGVTLGLMVRANSAGGSKQATADASGRFEFGQLPPGRFLIVAQKPGYDMPASSADLGYITLPEGVTREGIIVRLDRWSSVEGRIVDERGDPMEGALVQLLRPSYEDGRKSLMPLATCQPPPFRRQLVTRTDDRGFYRIFQIPEGRYLLSATVGSLSSPELPGYPRTFFPGTADFASAQPLVVTPGAELRDISMAIVRAKTYRVSGQMLDTGGQPLVGGTLILIPDESEAIGITADARIEPDGSFEFVNVQPGRYLVQMSRGVTFARQEGGFAAVPVRVTDSDVTGVAVHSLPGSTISGTIAFNTAQPGARPDAGWLQLSAVPLNRLLAPPTLASAELDREWNFVLEGITGTRRLQATRLPDGWTVEAIRANGQDILDKPVFFAGQPLKDVEVVLTDKVSVVGGIVVTALVPLPRSGVVVAFSTDSSLWYHASRFMRRVTSSSNGQFKVTGLPAGDYYLAALQLDPAGDTWEDPEFLTALSSRATRVSLTEGAPVTVSLEAVLVK